MPAYAGLLDIVDDGGAWCKVAAALAGRKAPSFKVKPQRPVKPVDGATAMRTANTVGGTPANPRPATTPGGSFTPTTPNSRATNPTTVKTSQVLKTIGKATDVAFAGSRAAQPSSLISAGANPIQTANTVGSNVANAASAADLASGAKAISHAAPKAMNVLKPVARTAVGAGLAVNALDAANHAFANPQTGKLNLDVRRNIVGNNENIIGGVARGTPARQMAAGALSGVSSAIPTTAAAVQAGAGAVGNVASSAMRSGFGNTMQYLRTGTMK